MEVVRDGKKYVVSEGYDWFWKQFADGTWEPNTFKIFDTFLNPGEKMLDIGAWIGPTALYAAAKAKQVFAFEPDAIAFFHLIQNIELNRIQNIVPYPIAVSNEWKGINFGPKNGSYGDSMASELWGKNGGSQVPAAAFQVLVADIMPGFIKIDIEGGEKNIFDGAALLLGQIKPTIYLSLHTPWHVTDLESFKKHIIAGLQEYPYFYDDSLRPIKLEDAFTVSGFTSVVATFTKL